MWSGGSLCVFCEALERSLTFRRSLAAAQGGFLFLRQDHAAAAMRGRARWGDLTHAPSPVRQCASRAGSVPGLRAPPHPLSGSLPRCDCCCCGLCLRGCGRGCLWSLCLRLAAELISILCGAAAACGGGGDDSQSHGGLPLSDGSMTSRECTGVARRRHALRTASAREDTSLARLLASRQPRLKAPSACIAQHALWCGTQHLAGCGVVKGRRSRRDEPARA